MKSLLNIFCCLMMLLTGCIAATAQTEKQIAFPGAEGFGRYATGGRGGEVRHVTNLNDSGTGSLRAALNGSAKKIIVFDVSGTIHLKSQLNITNNTTIAGQSAPGDGICVADAPCQIKGNNIIVRYMRFRLGNKNVDLDLASDGRYDGWDGFGGLDVNNIIIDHCSVSWSIDECLSMSGCRDITVQWCMVAQSMVKGHSKLSHGYGGNWGGAGSSYHHNLMIHHNSRVPRLGPRPTTQLDERMDMRNNVFYNWAGNGCYGGEAMKVNIVNNYYKPGPATDTRGTKYRYRIAAPGIRTTEYVTNSPAYKPAWHIWGKYYVTGNVNPDYPALSASDANQWNMGIYEQIDASGNDGTYTDKTKDTIKITEPIPFVAVTTHSAEKAYEKVLKYVGASLYRDGFDELMVSDATNRKATNTGSGNAPGIVNTQDDNTTIISTYGSAWPTLNSTTAPTDTDQDGMPDEWEDAHGLNKNDKSDGSKYATGTAYTNVEVYLNSLVADITAAQNEGGALMGETLESESKPVSYTLSNDTYKSSTDGVYTFDNGITISGGTCTFASTNTFSTFGVEANKKYTITLPDSITITKISISGFSNSKAPTTSYLKEANGTNYNSSDYKFPNKSGNATATHDITLATAAKGSMTFTIGGNPTYLYMVLEGTKEGKGVVVNPDDNPNPNPDEGGESVEYDITPATHEEGWSFGNVSITISGKDYAEGHVSSDFTGIKFSRNTNYTINLPSGVSITSVEVKGYSNGDGTTFVEKLGENTFTANDYTFESKVTSSHLYMLSTPASGTMVFRPSGDNQMVATLKLTGKKGSTGISMLKNDYRQNHALYNLQGVRVKTPSKGLYIQNGKKIVIR